MFVLNCCNISSTEFISGGSDILVAVGAGVRQIVLVLFQIPPRDVDLTLRLPPGRAYIFSVREAAVFNIFGLLMLVFCNISSLVRQRLGLDR